MQDSADSEASSPATPSITLRLLFLAAFVRKQTQNDAPCVEPEIPQAVNLYKYICPLKTHPESIV